MNHHERDDDFEARKREIMRKRAAAKKKRQVAALRRGIIMLSIVLVIVLVILSLTVFFPIKSIKVTGNSVIYNSKQIIEASGITSGQNIFMSGLNAEENITTKLPYISSVEIQRDFPSSVIINVKMAKATVCYKTKSGKYLLCDGQNKVLEMLKTSPNNVPVFMGTNVSDTSAGKVVSFTNEDKIKIAERTKKLLTESSLKINLIDVTDLLDIKIKVEDRFHVKLGSSGNLDNKIAHLESMVTKMSKNRKGTIDLNDYSPENPRGIFVEE